MMKVQNRFLLTGTLNRVEFDGATERERVIVSGTTLVLSANLERGSSYRRLSDLVGAEIAVVYQTTGAPSLHELPVLLDWWWPQALHDPGFYPGAQTQTKAPTDTPRLQEHWSAEAGSVAADFLKWLTEQRLVALQADDRRAIDLVLTALVRDAIRKEAHAVEAATMIATVAAITPYTPSPPDRVSSCHEAPIRQNGYGSKCSVCHRDLRDNEILAKAPSTKLEHRTLWHGYLTELKASPSDDEWPLAHVRVGTVNTAGQGRSFAASPRYTPRYTALTECKVGMPIMVLDDNSGGIVDWWDAFDGRVLGQPAVDDPAPIPMLLWCPMCHERHIDEGEFATKPHKDHSCQRCGLTWRPAKVPTCGVAFLPGYKNEEK